MEFNILKSLIFFGFAGTILLFALLTVFSKRIIYALVSALFVFFASAGIFFLLGADYNAVVQLSIYGIAIPVLFVLAIMFTSEKSDKKTYLSFNPRFYITIMFSGILFLALAYLIAISLSLTSNAVWILEKQTLVINKYQMFHSIADGFFNKYLIAFELFSVLLLIVIVGISTLLVKERKDD